MLLIRRFEERLFKLFESGEINGTIHTYLGQEAIAVGCLNHLIKNDVVISNHRCHGHYLVRTNDVVGLLAEIFGKEGGVCRGRGGSQHVHRDNFFSNGVQGNMFPVAAGMAFAEKRKQNEAIVVVFIGDGTFGEGVIYETLNILALWSLPMLVVVENNQYAQSTNLKKNFAGTFSGRIKGFNISVGEIETNDVNILYNRFGPIINEIRETKSPHVEIVHTYRLGPHSKGDDDRPSDEIDFWKKNDPLTIYQKKINNAQIKKIETEVNRIIQEAEKTVRVMPS